MHRLFVALRPPPELRGILSEATHDGPPGVRWQDDEQLHVTLRFVGEVDRRRAEDLAAALSSLRAPRISIQLAGVGRFDQGRRGALWVAVSPKDALTTLHDKIGRACLLAGIGSDRRAFHPHVTLGRWSGGPVDATDWLVRHATLSSQPFEIGHFALFESHLGRHGALYEEVARTPLA